jgi:hypothetical protein
VAAARWVVAAVVAQLVIAGCSSEPAPPDVAVPPEGGDATETDDRAVPADDPTDGTETDTSDGGARAPADLEVSHPTVWLCLPGRDHDPCAGDLDAEVLGGDGSRTPEPFTPAAAPAADCFYVYPTVSEAESRNAPLEVTEELVRTARAQAARFSEVCRVFAPVYRQVTVAGLLSGGLRDPEARELAHGDVVSAWNDYLVEHNDGRPFVLLGHSQGTFELTRLVQERIDPDPQLRGQLVSALLIGGEVRVPVGEDVGGDFLHVPACRSFDQTGCVVAYNSFAEPPASFALFGRASGAREVLCVNPAAPVGGQAPLRPYLPNAAVDGFVTAEDAVTAECRRDDGASWLHVEVDARLADRVGAGDGPDLGGAWGLHRGDVNLALGDLVELVRRQSAAAS